MENLPKRVSSAKPPKWSKFLQNSAKGTKELSLDLKTSPSETSSAQSSPMSTRMFTKGSKVQFESASLSFEKMPSYKNSQLNLKIPKNFDESLDSLRTKNIKQAASIDQHEISLDPNVPSLIWCSYCKGEKQYILEHRPSNYTFLASLSIFLAGGVLGCFLVPYLMPSCQTLYKKCSQCQRLVQ